MQLAQIAFDMACPPNRFLEEMATIVDWQWFDKELNKVIVRKSGGRPPYPLILLFKMHLLQTWFGLGDEACEYQVRDRMSFRRFLGLGIDSRIPDATTLENFRHDFAPVASQVMSRLDQYFKDKGLLLKEGNMVDATFIKANGRFKKKQKEQSDLDADHGHKGYGYSATANVDVKTKLIRKVVTTSAKPHDSQMTKPALVGDEDILYGDSAYSGQKNVVKKPRFMAKRKRGKQGEKRTELPLRLKYLNRLYSKTRVRVEHVFACWKTVFKVTKAWYRGGERVNQQIQSLAIAYNLRRYGYLKRA